MLLTFLRDTPRPGLATQVSATSPKNTTWPAAINSEEGAGITRGDWLLQEDF
jgi:hypothetical protein